MALTFNKSFALLIGRASIMFENNIKHRNPFRNGFMRKVNRWFNLNC